MSLPAVPQCSGTCLAKTEPWLGLSRPLQIWACETDADWLVGQPAAPLGYQGFCNVSVPAHLMARAGRVTTPDGDQGRMLWFALTQPTSRLTATRESVGVLIAAKAAISDERGC